MSSFLWHDYESFGVDPKFDRPAEFAAIRTDQDLQVVGEAVVWRCKPTLDYLPSPEACAITGIGPESCWQDGLPEPEFAAAIFELMSVPGTTSLGYNSIRFDDEMTRHLFWRNLLDPYVREWANGNSRFDLIDTVRAAYALRPDGFVWPQHADGRPSFRLEDLALANQLPHSHAHSALSDVEATIALARRLRELQPRLWTHALSLRDKRVVAGMMDLAAKKPLVHVSQRFAADRGCLAMVLPLIAHPSQAQKFVVFDLGLDPGPLLELEAEAIVERLLLPSEQAEAAGGRVGLKVVHANRAPFLAPLSVLTGVDTARIALHADLCLARAERLRGASDLEPKLRAVYALLERGHAVAARPPVDVDTDLYGGFLPDGDRARLREWLRLSPAERIAALPLPTLDARVDELCFRHCARHHEALLSEPQRERWIQHCQQVLRAGRLSLQRYRELCAATELAPALREELAQWGARCAAHAKLSA